MKKIILIAAVALGAFVLLSPKYFFGRQAVIPTSSETKVSATVSVTLDNGTTIATASAVRATNAYQALVEAAKANTLELKTKQYDFGVFVEQVGDVSNTKEKSWIYFVNGKAGSVAADKQPLGDKDVVEWKYLAPTVE